MTGVVSSTPSGLSYSQIALADMNHDGFPDFVLSGQNGTDQTDAFVMLGDLSHPGRFIFGDPVPLGLLVSSVIIGDFNGDGFPDILTVQNSNLLFSATTRQPRPFSSSSTGVRGIAQGPYIELPR